MLGIIALGEVRDNIAALDMADYASWPKLIRELARDMSLDEIGYELAASPKVIENWKGGRAQPREMTRRLLQRSLVELLDERLGQAPEAVKTNTLIAIGFVGCMMVYINVEREEAIRRYHAANDHMTEEEVRAMVEEEFTFSDEFEAYAVDPPL